MAKYYTDCAGKSHKLYSESKGGKTRQYYQIRTKAGGLRKIVLMPSRSKARSSAARSPRRLTNRRAYGSKSPGRKGYKGKYYKGHRLYKDCDGRSVYRVRTKTGMRELRVPKGALSSPKRMKSPSYRSRK